MSCFTTGTSITTLTGEKKVEDLRVGDRIVTRDNGLQTVRRISRRHCDYGKLSTAPHLQPILVTTGALGKGLPERDMLVSQNIRVLVSHDRVPFDQKTAPGARDVLIAAKRLNDSRKIRGCSVLGVSYLLVEFDRHETILANGCWVEAFCLSDLSDGSHGNAQRTEIQEIFPQFGSNAPSFKLADGQ